MIKLKTFTTDNEWSNLVAIPFSESIPNPGLPSIIYGDFAADGFTDDGLGIVVNTRVEDDLDYILTGHTFNTETVGTTIALTEPFAVTPSGSSPFFLSTSINSSGQGIWSIYINLDI